MILIGCDFHPSWQQVCWLDRETGETPEECKLVHAPGEVENFYRRFAVPTLIGMEATGNCQWFVELVTVLEGMTSGLEMRPRSALATHGNRSTTGGTPRSCYGCWWKDGFRESGRRRASNETTGSC